MHWRLGEGRGEDPQWKRALRRAFDEEAALGRVVSSVLTFFILATAVAVALETLPNLPDWARLALFAFEIAAVTVFALEYLLRLLSAHAPLRYALSIWGVIDLLAFLPTLLFLGFDLLALRSLRLLRLLRLLKLVHNDAAMQRLRDAVVSVREELLIVVTAAAIVLYLAATGIYFFEHSAQPDDFGSIPQSLWWAIATLTTVGYGDVVPITMGGRIFTGFVMLIGIGVVAVPTGLVATALISLQRQAEEARRAAAAAQKAAHEAPAEKDTDGTEG